MSKSSQSHVLSSEALSCDDMADGLLDGARSVLQEAGAIPNGIRTLDNEGQAWAQAKKPERDRGGFAARIPLTMIALKAKLGGE